MMGDLIVDPKRDATDYTMLFYDITARVHYLQPYNPETVSGKIALRIIYETKRLQKHKDIWYKTSSNSSIHRPSTPLFQFPIKE
jgi:hypothetical protein